MNRRSFTKSIAALAIACFVPRKNKAAKSINDWIPTVPSDSPLLEMHTDQDRANLLATRRLKAVSNITTEMPAIDATGFFTAGAPRDHYSTSAVWVPGKGVEFRSAPVADWKNRGQL